MSQETWTWTAQRERTAQLVAEDRLSDEQIATEVGISRKTIERWKHEAPFTARVAEHVEAYRQAVLSRGIADRVQRVAILDDTAQRIQRLIEARAQDLAHVPGGDTGLLVHQQKQVGAGKTAQVIDEYAADTALLRERRETLKQAAIEVGQWQEKHELSGKDGAAVVFTLHLDRAGGDGPDAG